AKDDGDVAQPAPAPRPVAASVGRLVTFTKDILPIFQNRCNLCHGVAQNGGLKLDSLENVMKGGAKGAALKPNDPNNSRIVQMVEGRIQPRMPKGGQPLS